MGIEELTEIAISFLKAWDSELEDQLVTTLIETDTAQKQARKIKDILAEKVVVERQLIFQKYVLEMYKRNHQDEDEIDKFLRDLRNQDRY